MPQLVRPSLAAGRDTTEAPFCIPMNMDGAPGGRRANALPNPSRTASSESSGVGEVVGMIHGSGRIDARRLPLEIAATDSRQSRPSIEHHPGGGERWPSTSRRLAAATA